MKLQTLLFATIILTLSSVNAGEKLQVKVKGMVCSFCAQGIKKKFNAIESVSNVDVNLDDKIVKLELKDNNTLNDDLVKSTINSAGYDVVSIDRSSQVPSKEKK